jgi:hypothetical protein
MMSEAANITSAKDAPQPRRAGSPLEVLLVFLKLGVSCFGGPIAHIGYFRELAGGAFLDAKRNDRDGLRLGQVIPLPRVGCDLRTFLQPTSRASSAISPACQSICLIGNTVRSSFGD